ncbi:hypothetical protein Neosp_014874 [[Neocosmospora] mangrovei]
MPKNQELIFHTGSTLPCGDYPNMSLTPPPENGTIENGTSDKKAIIYIYIDESNFWIGGKKKPEQDWTYDIESFLSLLAQETAIGKDMKKNDYGVKVRVYGCFPIPIKRKWKTQSATVDEHAGPRLVDANGNKREKEVDTALVAHSVREACEGHKHPGLRREFVIVSGDRDMRPAVEIIYGGDYPAPVHIWAWDQTVASVYRDLHRSRHAVTLHLLDNHLYAIREGGQQDGEDGEKEEESQRYRGKKRKSVG